MIWKQDLNIYGIAAIVLMKQSTWTEKCRESIILQIYWKYFQVFKQVRWYMLILFGYVYIFSSINVFYTYKRSPDESGELKTTWVV